MRGFQLARIAVEAERLRMRGLVRRYVTRIIFAVLAIFFLVGALVFVHFAAWYGLRSGLDLSFLVSTAIFGGVDLVAAIALGLLAGRSAPSHGELQAIAVRRQALAGIASDVRWTQLLISVAGLLRRRSSRGDL